MQNQVLQVVQELFPVYDRDRSGYLETRELGGFLTAALKRLGVNATVTNEQAEQALKVIDRNRDNEVSQSQAAEALKSILEYKQQRNRQGGNGNTGGTGGTSYSGNTSWQQPQVPPPQQNQFSANNGWGPNPPFPSNPYGNSWGPSQPQQQGSWQPQPPPQYNNWNQPANNSWTPPANTGGWGQPAPNYGGQYNSWSPSNNNGGWQSSTDPQDQQLQRLIDQLYLRYDRDRSGTLDKREMVQAFNELLAEFGVNTRVNNRQAGQLIRIVDSSGDGKVNKQQFLRMLKMLLSGDDF